MDASREKLLQELEAYGAAHDRKHSDRLRRLRNVERETAAMMALLVRASRARALLEIGTSNGYATVWLGDAAQSTGGHLLSVDNDVGRGAMAAETIARAALQELVELRIEDGAETLAAQQASSLDFIFLDAERPAYVGYWEDLVRVLASPGLLVIDNAISHRDELVEFTALVDQDDRVTSTLVPVGAGAMLVTLDR